MSEFPPAPGGPLAPPIVPRIFVIDCSRSAADAGRLLRDAWPQVQAFHALERKWWGFSEHRVQAIAVTNRAEWVIELPTPDDEIAWPELPSGGEDAALGAALELAVQPFGTERRRFPPTLVLISGGRPTDDTAAGLAALDAARFYRVAIAVGPEPDYGWLGRFAHGPFDVLHAARTPQQLLDALIRWRCEATARIIPFDGPPIPVEECVQHYLQALTGPPERGPDHGIEGEAVW